jgi:non-homologous end joining protein Ku
MGAYRKGIVLSFGLVNVICNIETAIEREKSLSSVCCGTANNEHPPTQVTQKMNCVTCGTVAYGDVKKARKVGESFVMVEQEEVATIKNTVVGATKKLIALTPHDAEEISTNTLQAASVYAVVPSDTAQAPAYGLLVDTLNRHPEVGFLALWTPSSRPNLYQLKVFGDSLVLEQRARTEDIKVQPQEITPVDVSLQGQIDSLLPGMVKPFDPATYTDTYTRHLDDLLASREAVEGVVPDRPKSNGPAPVKGGVDLTAALAAMAAQAS